ncbi:GUN4 domain-containing protein [Nostoc sp. CHAB 5715]|uniref:GUN4 domain-containing protein n=1 Tax=Nostoc sp. CHAB 5715 TaxID=2780400 RepID=UPI001E64ADC3|nr:GUN4 domain-containing protein [Nostoc sp. CHAB 5715]MCC5623238.1 GUN4 domain-containing protein [Nostoc sp. CHAB 5715]
MPKDVFLCHNSKEKVEVEKIRAQLLQEGIDAWLDKYDFEPFRRWQDQLEEIIPQVKAVAVFIGSSGVGPWADIEMKEFLVEFAKNHKLRIGLVILPGCPDKLINTVPRFLKGFHWVDFRLQNPDPMEQLIWGITGQKPKTQPITSSQSPQKPSDRRQFLKWVGLGTFGLVMSVVGREIWIKLDQPTVTKDESTSLGESTQTRTPEVKPSENISLESEKGIDYTKLRNLLAEGNWKGADSETFKVMNKALNGTWSSKKLLNFPCTDLRTIDKLWVKYSDGHFGFSVQKEIYLSVGGKADGKYYEKAWEKFGDRVGWRVKSIWIDDYSDVTFNTSSSKGHLPALMSWTTDRLEVDGWGEWSFKLELDQISSLVSRLVNCNI